MYDELQKTMESMHVDMDIMYQDNSPRLNNQLETIVKGCNKPYVTVDKDKISYW